MKTQIFAAATLVILGLISGCGGSGTSSSTIPISGVVADGYLINATVFLDKNYNYQLDPGEPSTASSDNGAYTLNLDPADVGEFPIVVLATKGQTIDKDAGLAVLNSFILSMPAKAVSSTVGDNFISPISSQIRELMETGKYSTLQQAMDQVRTQMGLPVGTPVLADFIANNNSAMHTAAQNIASLMGSQMSQVLGTNGTSTTIDVNRYRAMMGTIFCNLSSVKRANVESRMSTLRSSLTTVVGDIMPGQPFRNMSSSFRDEHGLRSQIPPIVEHFACSDYCPGPSENYTVKVYQGIEDANECRRLGGRPATYSGWGIFRICIAEEQAAQP